jgi:hypothetical protein
LIKGHISPDEENEELRKRRRRRRIVFTRPGADYVAPGNQ